jgi:hypothetical protein
MVIENRTDHCYEANEYGYECGPNCPVRGQFDVCSDLQRARVISETADSAAVAEARRKVGLDGQSQIIG